MSTTYTVTAERVGQYWLLQVPVAARSSQARWASEVRPMAVDLIAAATNLSSDEFEVEVEWVLPAEVQQHLELAEHYRGQEAEARVRAAREARAAAKALHATGLGASEVGAVMGVSRQRAHQLIAS